MDILIFFALLIVGVAGNGLDWYSSQDFEYYGLTEGNKLMRDENGFFNSRLNLIGSIVLVTLPFLVFIFDPQYAAFAGVWNLIIGGVRGFVGFGNLKEKKENRVRQIAWLRRFKAGEPMALKLRQVSKTKRWYSTLFGFFYVESGGQADAYSEITAKITALVNYPENQWFDKSLTQKIQREIKTK